MIVDLMRNDIGRVAVAGSVKVPELFVVEPFPAVHHLVSTITGGAQLPEQLHASDLLRAAFPGGSITGPESTGYGNYRRTGTAATQCLVRQHWLFELLRQHGHQHYYPHADCH